MLKKPYIALLLLLLIIAPPIFNRLDSAPLLQWDEARLAVGAFEMSNNHNWIVVMFNGQPDMWSTKPPLMIWLQVLMMKIIGINELAVRLPAALAALGTCLLIFFFFTKKYKEPLLGLISAAILVTTRGYVAFHGIRTGDDDSLLTMLMAGYALFYYLYLDSGKRKYLLITFALLILAALTKGIESLIFLPALFIYTVYKKQVITTLKQKELYIGIAGFLFFVIGYYLLRDHYNPGYIDAVKVNELGGRYTTVIENHAGDEWYYYNVLVDSMFHEWYLLVLPGIVIGIASKQHWIKEVTLYSAILVFTYLLAVSGAKTKIDWYLMPVFPFLAIITGVLLYSICKLLAGFESWKQIMSYNFLPLLFLFLVFAVPYASIITNVTTAKYSIYEAPEQKDMQQFMKNVLHKEANIDGCTVLNENLEQNLCWYLWVIQFKDHAVKSADRDNIADNGKIVAFLPDSKKYIESHYNTQILQTFNNVTVYQLNGKKLQ